MSPPRQLFSESGQSASGEHKVIASSGVLLIFERLPALPAAGAVASRAGALSCESAIICATTTIATVQGHHYIVRASAGRRLIQASPPALAGPSAVLLTTARTSAYTTGRSHLSSYSRLRSPDRSWWPSRREAVCSVPARRCLTRAWLMSSLVARWCTRAGAHVLERGASQWQPTVGGQRALTNGTS
jgi:hypothetical protein